jgi:hypothetical protein
MRFTLLTRKYFAVAVGICFSMTDVFRSEILAVVMQQLVDEPNLPVLFLRTVSKPVHNLGTLLIHPSGDTSCDNVQVSCGFRLDDPAITAHHQKNLDQSSSVGRVHKMCESNSTCQLWSFIATS